MRYNGQQLLPQTRKYKQAQCTKHTSNINFDYPDWRLVKLLLKCGCLGLQSLTDLTFPADLLTLVFCCTFLHKVLGSIFDSNVNCAYKQVHDVWLHNKFTTILHDQSKQWK